MIHVEYTVLHVEQCWALTSLPRYDVMENEIRRGGKCFFGGDISPLIALCCCKIFEHSSEIYFHPWLI